MKIINFNVNNVIINAQNVQQIVKSVQFANQIGSYQIVIVKIICKRIAKQKNAKNNKITLIFEL